MSPTTESDRNLVDEKEYVNTNNEEFGICPAQKVELYPEGNTAQISSNDMDAVPPISFFEKWLSVWVLLCMVTGALIGAFAPASAAALAQASFAQINAIVAVFLWCMILPMLIQIDFEAIKAVRKVPGAVVLTTTMNYLVKPFTMYGFAILFFRVFYTGIIDDVNLCDEYIAGLILLAAAPCTAMVFVWSSLTGGDAAYTLVQVAFNDLLMLGLYVPICVLLIGVSNIPLPWLTITYAVLLFIVAPTFIAVIARALIIRNYGIKALDGLVNRFKPVTIICLLLTLILIFIFQGQKIADKPLQIVLIAMPITIQCASNFFIAYYIGYSTCLPHDKLAPASMIATSNFFELAVAVAISVYGLDSGAALATVVGVLVEVPLMLLFTYYCKYMRPHLEERISKCDEICPLKGSILCRPKNVETVDTVYPTSDSAPPAEV